MCTVRSLIQVSRKNCALVRWAAKTHPTVLKNWGPDNHLRQQLATLLTKVVVLVKQVNIYVVWYSFIYGNCAAGSDKGGHFILETGCQCVRSTCKQSTRSIRVCQYRPVSGPRRHERRTCKYRCLLWCDNRPARG